MPSFEDMEGRTFGQMENSMGASREVPNTRLLARVEPWFEAAFARHNAGEAVEWEIGIMVYPAPQASQFVPMIGLSASIAGALPATTVGIGAVVPFQGLQEPVVDEAIRRLLEDLRGYRSHQLGEATAAAAQDNGAPPTGGISLPEGAS